MKRQDFRKRPRILWQVSTTTHEGDTPTWKREWPPVGSQVLGEIMIRFPKFTNVPTGLGASKLGKSCREPKAARVRAVRWMFWKVLGIRITKTL